MKRLLFLFLAVLIVFPVFAQRQSMPRFSVPSARTNGMGGPHIAFTDNIYSMIVNPGAMMRTNERSFVNIAPSLYSPGLMAGLISPLMGMTSSNFNDVLKDFLTPIAEQGGQMAVGLEMQALPLISFASVRSGFGIGFWQRMSFDVRFNGLNSYADFIMDVMVPLGFGFSILSNNNHVIDAGFTIMPFARSFSYLGPKSALDLVDDASSFFRDFEAPLIIGGTMSAGLIYRLGDGFSAGLTFNDFFSFGREIFKLSSNNLSAGNTTTYYVPFTMDLGVAYNFRFNHIFNLAIAASWHDILNVFKQNDYLNSRNFILDFSAGAELRMFNTVNIRMGIREMLPALGLGLDLGPFKIDASWYGREIGIEPGDFPMSIAEITISIRTQPSPTSRFYNRRSVIGLFGGPEN